MPITAAAEQQIKSILNACTDPEKGTGVPGLAFCAIGKDGKYLTTQTSGTTGLNEKTPVDLDTVFWIASCTKIVTGIACMQLSEQGKVDLDSSEQLYHIAPELKNMKVMTTDGQLEPRSSEITLRMLLSHTAGFGYSFFDEKVFKLGVDELAGDAHAIYKQNLCNQPGSRWEYGINIDWAGIVVERVSGLTLDEYFKRKIFQPLGIHNISFFPSEHMKEHMVTCVQRDGDGKPSQLPQHPYHKAINATSENKSDVFQAGGAGCFAKPAEYCVLLAALLNDGESPNTHERILSKASVDEMFKNQIPEFPQFGRQGIMPPKPAWSNPLPDLYPQEGNPAQGWGLTWFLTLEPGMTGRGPNTAWWAGIVNLFYWVDRAKGVAGIIASQVLPFGDPNVLGAWVGCEKAVYDGLQ